MMSISLMNEDMRPCSSAISMVQVAPITASSTMSKTSN